MKKIIYVVFTLIIAFLGAYYYFSKYSSAFEADQACHYALWKYEDKISELGCDHDIETHQWILYQVAENHSPALVIKRFHY